MRAFAPFTERNRLLLKDACKQAISSCDSREKFEQSPRKCGPGNFPRRAYGLPSRPGAPWRRTMGRALLARPDEVVRAYMHHSSSREDTKVTRRRKKRPTDFYFPA